MRAHLEVSSDADRVDDQGVQVCAEAGGVVRLTENGIAPGSEAADIETHKHVISRPQTQHERQPRGIKILIPGSVM